MKKASIASIYRTTRRLQCLSSLVTCW